MTNVSVSKPKTITKSYMTPHEYALMMGVTECTIRSRMYGTLKEFTGVEDGKKVIYTSVFTKYPPSDTAAFERKHNSLTRSEVEAIIDWAKKHKATPVQTAKHFGLNYFNAISLFKSHARALAAARAVAPYAASTDSRVMQIRLTDLERMLGCKVKIIE